MLGIHILLAVALAAFSDALSPLGITGAFVLVYLVLKLGENMFGAHQYSVRLERGTRFAFWFAKEVFKASFDVARVVFSVQVRPSPAIVRIVLSRRDERLATLVGCLLTLTPGTMALEYDPETGELYVHALDTLTVESVEESVREIESRLLEWMDPPEDTTREEGVG